MLLSGRQVDHLQRILLFIEDITERREAQAGIRSFGDSLPPSV